MSLCVEVRFPPAIRRQRALRLAAEELGTASLDEVINLASQICRMTIYADFALDFFQGEALDFELKQVGNSDFVVRRRSISSLSAV